MPINSKPKASFLKTIKTDQDVLEALDYLSALKNSNFEKKEELLEKYSKWEDFTKEALQRYQEDRGYFLEFISGAEKKIHEKEKIIVEMNESPSPEFTKRLYDIFEKNLPFGFIIDYEIDPQAEGVRFSIKGKYIKADLKNLLKSYIIKNHGSN